MIQESHRPSRTQFHVGSPWSPTLAPGKRRKDGARNFVVSWRCEKQQQKQLQVLRLRLPRKRRQSRLRKTSLWGGFAVSHPKRKDKDALRVGHPRVVVSLHRKSKCKNNRREWICGIPGPQVRGTGGTRKLLCYGNCSVVWLESLCGVVDSLPAGFVGE